MGDVFPPGPERTLTRGASGGSLATVLPPEVATLTGTIPGTDPTLNHVVETKPVLVGGTRPLADPNPGHKVIPVVPFNLPASYPPPSAYPPTAPVPTGQYYSPAYNPGVYVDPYAPNMTYLPPVSGVLPPGFPGATLGSPRDAEKQPEKISEGARGALALVSGTAGALFFL